jgi:hypothetical protein
MMGVWTPETCRAVNKRHDNKLDKLLYLVGDLFEPNSIWSALQIIKTLIMQFYPFLHYLIDHLR